MAIIYVDLASGNDTTGDGSYTLPYKLVNKALSIGGGPHDIRVAKTTAAAAIAGNSYTWTYNSLTVTVNADVTASIAVNDFIGKPTASGNGSFDTFYKVTAISYSAGTGLTSITLLNKYHGTTATTTGALKQAIVTTGLSNATAISISVSGTNLSGGWNLTNQTQDGETWFQPNGAAGSYVGIAHTVTCTISKLNQANASQAILSSSHLTLSDTTLIPVLGSSYGILNQTSNSNITVTNVVMFSSNSTVPLYTPAATTGTQTYTNVYLIGGFQCFYVAGQTNKGQITFSNVNMYFGVTSGINLQGNNYLDLTGVKVYNSASAVICGTGYNVYINNGEAISCSSGVSINASGIINGTTFTNCTNGVYVANGTRNGLKVMNCTFSGNQYCVLQDSYNSPVLIANCNFGTPTSYAVSRRAISNTITIDKCIIDAGQESKLINNTGTDIQANPFYVISNCGNSSYPDGAYYGYTTAQLNNTTYETSSPSLRIKCGTTQSANQVQDIPIVTTYTNNGYGKTISMKILADVSWVGSIIPVWLLNGAIVKEETAITSIANSWNTYSYTIANGLIDRSGSLSLCFRCNMNTVALYIDKAITIT